MNLYASFDGKELALYQTPTWITRICLMDEKGEIINPAKGFLAERAIQCYCVWFENEYILPEEDKNFLKDAQKHLKAIKNALKSGWEFKAWTI